jgi:hypothetical protein
VKDKNGNSLGTLMALNGTTLTLYNSGYIIYVNLDGTFNPSTIYWVNGGTCGTGSAYLSDGESGVAGIQTYAKTLAWSGAANQWYVVTGSATDNVITSEAQPGTTTSVDTPPASTGYSPYTNYFSPGDFSDESGGNSDGSFSCAIHQDYGENYNESTFTYGSPHLVTSSNPEADTNIELPSGNGTYTLDYGLDFSGWALETFSPQSTLGWPAFTTCTVTVYGGTNGENPNGTPANPTTTTNSCVAAPLQLP